MKYPEYPFYLVDERTGEVLDEVQTYPEVEAMIDRHAEVASNCHVTFGAEFSLPADWVKEN